MTELIKSTIEFIRDHYKSNDFIPLHQPKFVGNEKEYVMNTINSTYVSSVGSYVDLVEKKISNISRTGYGVAVVNGTAALQVALQVVGVNQGDEVITQALTFVATANAIRFNGADPIFLDVDYDTMGLSPTAVEKFLKNHCEIREEGCFNRLTGKKIAACLPMHTFGFPVHLNRLMDICAEWNIPLVEDAAESLGSEYFGKPTGSFGKAGVYSFNGNKIITSGGGGAIVTNDKSISKRAKHLTTTAKKSHEYEYYHDEVGFNYRMPNLNAALLCAQLEKLNLFLSLKRKHALQLQIFFTSTDIIFRKENPKTKANYWLYCVEVPDRSFRDEFLKVTNNEGVMTRPIWNLIYKLPMYDSCFRDDQKNAEYLEDRIINLPSSVII